MPHPGWVEHDAESVWWRDFVSICSELVPQASGRIAGVATSGLGPTLLLIDRAGRALRPAILYGVDTRSVEEITELTERYGEAAILRRWRLLRYEPGGGAEDAVGPAPRARCLGAGAPFPHGQLVPAPPPDRRVRARPPLRQPVRPLYDITENRWVDDWVREVAPGLEMPRLLWADEIAGTVTSAAAIATGIPAGTPVAMGTIDAWAEATSVGVRRPGDAMLMYGTALTLVAMVSPLRPLPAMWGVVGALPGTWSLAGGVTTSGALTKWFRGITGDPPFERLFDEARDMPVGSDGLVVLPYFSGERNPFFDPLARGVICGLTLAHSRGHLFRALLEGCAFATRHMLEAVSRLREAHLASSRWEEGPVTRSGHRCLGRHRPSAGDPARDGGASYGDAFFAATATGHVPRDASWNGPASTIVPRSSSAAVYADLYQCSRTVSGDVRASPCSRGAGMPQPCPGTTTRPSRLMELGRRRFGASDLVASTLGLGTAAFGGGGGAAASARRTMKPRSRSSCTPSIAA